MHVASDRRRKGFTPALNGFKPFAVEQLEIFCMGLLDRFTGGRKQPTTIYVDGKKASVARVLEPRQPSPSTKRPAVDWEAFVDETMQTEQSRSKTPAPPPLPKTPLLTRAGNYIIRLVLLCVVAPVVAIFALLLIVAAFAPRSAPHISPPLGGGTALRSFSSDSARSSQRATEVPSSGDSGGRVKVKGYTRKDGTKVEGYYRKK